MKQSMVSTKLVHKTHDGARSLVNQDLWEEAAQSIIGHGDDERCQSCMSDVAIGGDALLVCRTGIRYSNGSRTSFRPRSHVSERDSGGFDPANTTLQPPPTPMP